MRPQTAAARLQLMPSHNLTSLGGRPQDSLNTNSTYSKRSATPSITETHAAPLSPAQTSDLVALKSEALLLQRVFDDVRGSHSRHGMAQLEQWLLTLRPELMSTQSFLAHRGSLMECVLERIKWISTEVLNSCEDAIVDELSPSRTSAFLMLVDRVRSETTRTRRSAAENVEPAEGNAAPTSVDPTVPSPRGESVRGENMTTAHLQRLIHEQKSLHHDLRTLLRNPSGTEEIDALAAKHQKELDSLRAAEAAAKLDTVAAQQLIAGLQSRLAEAEAEIRRRDAEGEVEVAKRVRAFALGGHGPALAVLGLVGPTIPPNLPEAEAAQCVKGIHQLLAETMPMEEGRQRSRSVTKRDFRSAEVVEAQLWLYLQAQHDVVGKLIPMATHGPAALQDELQRLKKECESKSKVIAILESRVAQATAEKGKVEAALSAEKLEGHKYRKLLEPPQTSDQTSRSRILRSRGEGPTEAEIHRDLCGQIKVQTLKVSGLTSEIETLQRSLNEERQASAVLIHERGKLISQRDEVISKVKALESQLAEAGEVTSRESSVVGDLRRELRERTASEAEVQQKLWRTEVELRIARGATTDLQRQLAAARQDVELSRKSQTSLRRTVAKLRDAQAHDRAEQQQQLLSAQHERDAANIAGKAERQRSIDLERETDKLRASADRLSRLESNFANYAASKTALRMIAEEEEHMLSECLKDLQQDPFDIVDAKSEEDTLVLIAALEGDLEAIADNEKDMAAALTDAAKGRSGNDDIADLSTIRSNKKQLIQFMRKRYLTMQLNAARMALSFLQLKQQYRSDGVEHQYTVSTNTALTAEVSHLKNQVDALVHRIAEFDVDRKAQLKGRQVAEAEAKSLKAQVQRLHIHTEEQERLMVEAGIMLLNRDDKSASVATVTFE